MLPGASGWGTRLHHPLPVPFILHPVALVHVAAEAVREAAPIDLAPLAIALAVFPLSLVPVSALGPEDAKTLQRDRL